MENNNIAIFEKEEFGQVRTVMKDDEVWFVAKDVCEFFGEKNPWRAVEKLDEDEKGYTQIETPGGRQNVVVVNESGLYAMLFAMQPEKARGVTDEYVEQRKEQLRNFKRWVTHEVLPAIRKQGFYSALTDEKLLEVAFDRCLHNEEHQTLEFRLFRMQDELTIKRWEMMESVVWPKRFDHKSSKEAQQEIEELWGADVDGAIAAKEVWSKNVCSRYGMSRLYGKWKGPKNPLAYRKRTVNIDKIIEFEIQSAKSRFCMGLPDHDPMALRKKIMQQEEREEQIKDIVARTDKHLAKYDYDKKGEPVESVEEGLRKEKLWSDTFAFGHRELKDFLGM